MRMEAHGKNTRGGWGVFCGTLRKSRRAMKRIVRHGARQAGKRETERSRAED